jgi:hypothetical protein
MRIVPMRTGAVRTGTMRIVHVRTGSMRSAHMKNETGKTGIVRIVVAENVVSGPRENIRMRRKKRKAKIR